MRLHELEVEAFGPFTDRVHVDLDTLSGAGLFLLSGPTGAGKTSVLDAVCFALYGEVPGERQGARRLRSDQAEPGAEPRVRLVLTLGGRRLEITRSPAWQRPKKRGTGTTTQQACVLVRERVDGTWTTRSTRLDEAGHLLTGLLGMNLAQFTQVAMLPQGRFQAFLRASTDDRQRLLQRLFGTVRFERAEAWLRERRSEARRRCEAAHARLADTVGRLDEVAAVPVEEHPGWDVTDLAEPARAGALEAWAGALSETAAEDRSRLAGALLRATTAEQSARSALETGRAEADRRARRARALEELRALEQRADEHAEDAARLDAAHRAARVTPVRTLLEAAARQEAAARAEHQDAVTRGATLLGPAPCDDQVAWWDEQADAALAAAAAVDAARPSQQRAVDLAATLRTTRDELGRARTRAAALEATCASGPTALDDARARLEASRAAGVLADDARSRLRALEARGAAAEEVAQVLVLRTSAREALSEARSTVADAREHLLDLRERRIAGMAGEIAGDLAVGQSCPVCGSHEHPAKARTAPGSPDGAAERRAQRDLDDAETIAVVRADEVRSLDARLAVARSRAEGPVEDLAATRDELAGLEADAAQASTLEAELAALTADLDARRDELAAIRDTLARSESAAASLADQLASTEAALADVRGEHPDLDAAQRHHLDRVGAARRVVRAVGALGSAVERRREAHDDLDRAASDAGFAGTGHSAPADDAAAAELAPSAVVALEAALTDHRDRLSAARAVLRATEPVPGTDQSDDAAPIDVETLAADHARLLEELGDVRAREHHAAGRARRLAELGTELAETLAAWLPLREELDLVTSLSAFVDGRSADNRWQIRLSAYVLAYRLTQVVAAANVRLARMSDQRYSLEHTAERGRERRGGLGLLVRDDWSGLTRDPATLSGGETFVVSLALALGLSDVITAEAGGVELDTLFVDEGFGSLDAETLDDVMDTLDALRDGGRVVGVVSHVAEMRDRIPTQLRVTKARHGSRLAVHR